jgi:hypothetical protein
MTSRHSGPYPAGLPRRWFGSRQSYIPFHYASHNRCSQAAEPMHILPRRQNNPLGYRATCVTEGVFALAGRKLMPTLTCVNRRPGRSRPKSLAIALRIQEFRSWQVASLFIA